MNINITEGDDGVINIQISPSQEAPPWAVLLTQKVDLVLQKENTNMATLAEIQTKADATLAQVTAARTVDDAVKVVVDNNNVQLAALKQQLADAIAGGATPADLQKIADTIDAIQQTDLANGAIVSAAVTAGTPAAPSP